MSEATKNYVGAYYDYDSDKVLIWERPSTGGPRTLRRVDPPRYFYVEDEEGTYKSLYGETLKKYEFGSAEEFQEALRHFSRVQKFESDISPLFKVLMNDYYGIQAPKLHYAFVDIEVDIKVNLGWANTSNPYAPVNAITVYQSWTDKILTFAVPPKNWDGRLPTEQEEKDFELGHKLNLVICKNEKELLSHFLAAIDDADIISGWNSEFFDIPYLVKRLEIVMPKQLKQLCFPGTRNPRENKIQRFGEEQIAYKLQGRAHIDYLDLFKKFAQGVRYASYSLASIAEGELDVPKLSFDGTFEQFYNNEFWKFVLYNFRDVEIIVKLNQKHKFIELINTMAHENTCLFENLLGTVRYVETAMINRAHNVHNLIVRDKRAVEHHGVVDGALVLDPNPGLHEWLGSVDINSLYPSVIRSLNISPEMFIGQFVSGNCSSELMTNGDLFIDASPGEYDWAGIIDGDEFTHILRTVDGDDFEATGAEWQELLRDRKWAITAYGTVFDQSRGLGLIPDALAAWYSERKKLQASKKEWQVKLKQLEKDGASKEAIAEAALMVDYYEMLQMSKKLTLNSTYGAMLSPHFGLGRVEMGASTTACGRAITKHMIETIGNLLTGQETQVTWYRGSEAEDDDDDDTADRTNSKRTKCNNKRILLSDTDSCYFVTGASEKAEAIRIADETAEATNNTFPEFMLRKFLVQPGYEGLIKAGREIVGERGVFLRAKKKYTIKVVDQEGMAVNKLKTMGSELKKTDTPKVIREFLQEMMGMILDGKSYEDLEIFINQARKSIIYKIDNPLLLGAPKRINNLDAKYAEWRKVEKLGRGKLTLPGHVRAAINYNELVQEYEVGGKLIKAGDAGLIFYLKPNSRNLKSIAFPADLDGFPEWFTDNFAVDKKKMEDRLIDSKIEGVFDALEWDIPTPQNTVIKKLLRF